MKKILLSVLGIAALISCNKNQLDGNAELSEVPMGFGVYKGNAIISKANALEGDTFTLSAFKESATANTYETAVYSGISNKPLAYTSSWGLDQTYYFPIDGKNVKFVGYKTAAEITGTPTIENGGVTLTATIPNTTKNASFYVSKLESGIGSSSSPIIALQFNQILSQVNFMAKVTNKGDFTVTIKSINVNAKPTATFTNTTWGTVEGTSADWSALSTNAIITSADLASIEGASSVNLIPQAVTVAIVYDLSSVSLGNATGKSATASLTLEMGKSHNVNINIDPTTGLAEIKFSTPVLDDFGQGGASAEAK